MSYTYDSRVADAVDYASAGTAKPRAARVTKRHARVDVSYIHGDLDVLPAASWDALVALLCEAQRRKTPKLMYRSWRALLRDIDWSEREAEALRAALVGLIAGRRLRPRILEDAEVDDADRIVITFDAEFFERCSTSRCYARLCPGVIRRLRRDHRRAENILRLYVLVRCWRDEPAHWSWRTWATKIGVSPERGRAYFARWIAKAVAAISQAEGRGDGEMIKAVINEHTDCVVFMDSIRLSEKFAKAGL